jgi:hypothetical protein
VQRSIAKANAAEKEKNFVFDRHTRRVCVCVLSGALQCATQRHKPNTMAGRQHQEDRRDFSFLFFTQPITC